MQICQREKCTGCFACQNVCPKNCISMTEGKLGHLYPQIDESLCINCGACSRVCPQNEAPVFYEPTAALAAFNTCEEEHISSTSGGLAALFSKKVLREGGVVYGCSSEMGNEIKHARIAAIDDLWLLRGSKYVQSHIDSCYRSAKKDLENGATTLFIGTPCQIGGLRKTLGKEYENLITVDLLCHGVPSQKLLFEHLENIDTNGKYISFRSTAGQYLTLADQDGTITYKKSAQDDLFYSCFLSSLTLRDSCHGCAFAKLERCADITIGDFWGLSPQSKIKREHGVSLVLINTQKGSAFFEGCKDELETEQRPIAEAMAGNHPLREGAAIPAAREKFVSLYEKCGFEKAAKQVLAPARIKAKIKRPIRKVLNIIRHN